MLGNLGCVVAGITRPWLYYGSLFTSFCWHQEDDLFSSLNYMHPGSAHPKVWYGIAAEDSARFDRVVRQAVPLLFKQDPGALKGLNLMFPPHQLQRHGIRCYRVLQGPGDLIVTLPAAYHAGFSLGLNMTEAMNFASHDWLPVAVGRLGKGYSQSLLPLDHVAWNAFCSARGCDARRLEGACRTFY